MSKLKDKLSANMRMVKANQQPAPTKAAAPAKPVTKPVEKPAAPAPRRVAAADKTMAGEVPNSGTELFPTRVWPD